MKARKSIYGITEWNKTGLENSSSSFIVNVNEHLCRIEIEFMIKLRNVLKKYIVLITNSNVFCVLSSEHEGSEMFHQYILIYNSYKGDNKHWRLKICCIEG